ncbi:MAG: hypothetical protein ACRYF5_16920 [Janthinobacterium lividum]
MGETIISGRTENNRFEISLGAKLLLRMILHFNFFLAISICQFFEHDHRQDTTVEPASGQQGPFPVVLISAGQPSKQERVEAAISEHWLIQQHSLRISDLLSGILKKSANLHVGNFENAIILPMINISKRKLFKAYLSLIWY